MKNYLTRTTGSPVDVKFEDVTSRTVVKINDIHTNYLFLAGININENDIFAKIR